MATLFPMLSSQLPFARDFGLDRFLNNFESTNALPRVDIKDEKDHYELIADMPGFKKDDVKVNYQDGVLSISAQMQQETENNEDNYLRRERVSQSFERHFVVDNIKEDAIKAKMDNSVLNITLPKMTEAQQPQAKQIAIE